MIAVIKVAFKFPQMGKIFGWEMLEIGGCPLPINPLSIRTSNVTNNVIAF